MVSLSTAEAKYVEATHPYKEVVWIMKLCLDAGLCQRAITIQCDSNSSIFLAKNQTFHAKKKHIDIQNCNAICLTKNPTFHAKTKHIDIQYYSV